MPNIRDLRKRIRTVENIKRITSAMEKIAAARLFRSKGTLASSKPYVEALARMANDLLNSQPEAVHPLVEANDQGYVLAILVTSDRGLCGGYNTRVIQAAVDFADKVGRDKVKFVVFGRKGVDFLAKRGYEIVISHTGLPGQLTPEFTEQVSAKVIDLYLAKTVSEVHVVMTEFASVARHIPRVVRVLPVARLPETGRNYMNYSYEPAAGATIAAILPKLVRIRIWSAIVESTVSEHAARMFMMQRATKNTDDVIALLTLVMNKARQTAITRELTDIVGAAETIA
ncbi:MAG TPA: ATP synthase F1 subunit gamma [bacterium]|nr:ATP synthase F1 subunit gamma [bacterium]